MIPVTNSIPELEAAIPNLVADDKGHKWINHRDIVACVLCGLCKVGDPTKQSLCKGSTPPITLRAP